MAGRAIFYLAVALSLMTGTRAAVESTAAGASLSFLYTATARYEPLAWKHAEERFPAGARIFLYESSGKRQFAPEFSAAADPAVSFDGQRILFAGKRKADDSWQIWESDRNGDNLRRVSAGNEDCIRPFYLPGGRFVYARKIAGRFVVEAADLGGGKPLALTYAPANFLPTDILRDGRILLEAGYPLGTDGAPEIYTVYSDGSGMESYRCDHGRARYAGKQIASGDIIFSAVTSMARFTSSRAQEIPIKNPAGEYAGDIAELNSDDWLVSWRPNENSRFRLMRWSVGATSMQTVIRDDSTDIVQAVPLAEHATPKRHPSGLHDWSDANLLCLNAYTSKYSFAAGAVHAIRLYSGDDSGSATALGTAPVERDGSFFLHVPSDRPLQIELLDAEGRTLKREAGFFWMRRGEQRVCVGCHAGPETAPENAVPQVLLKSTTPADMTTAVRGSNSGGH